MKSINLSPSNPKPSFRTYLLSIVAIGIFCLAIIASLTTAWVTSKQTRGQLVTQGIKVTDNLAKQSILALIYLSEDNALEPLQNVIGFPDVDHAAIYDPDLNLLFTLEKETFPKRDLLPEMIKAPTALLIGEDDNRWHYLAPVQYGIDETDGDDAFQDVPIRNESTEVLGYAYVSMNKSTLSKMHRSILINNIVIALAFAVLLIIIMNFVITRLTRPLYRLSKVMREAEETETHVFAQPEGPKEIYLIARAFNRMMSILHEKDRRLNQHKEILEAEVSMRTQELVQACDAALTASRHKSEFLANMSHELRTPLQSVIGYIEVVKEELELDGFDQHAEDMELVMKNAQHLLNLINNILDLAKIEAGRMTLRLQNINLSELVNDAIATVKPMLEKNNNKVEININDQDDNILKIDKDKLKQSLLNLLSNAAKFTTDGTVSIEANRTDTLLEIIVADTGIGLSNEQQNIIFEQFRQVDGSSSRKFEGTGLGLSISKQFCHLMGGDISISSEENNGSTFTIRIPLPVHEIEPESSTEHLPKDTISSIYNIHPLVPIPADAYTLLLVDDDPNFLDIQVRSLEHAGYRVYTADNGEEALIQARSITPDLITLDIKMDGKDGWEILKELKDEAELQDIPVILVSCIDNKVQGYDLGADEYLIKPIERATLLMTINRICGDKEKIPDLDD